MVFAFDKAVEFRRARIPGFGGHLLRAVPVAQRYVVKRALCKARQVDQVWRACVRLLVVRERSEVQDATVGNDDSGLVPVPRVEILRRAQPSGGIDRFMPAQQGTGK